MDDNGERDADLTYLAKAGIDNGRIARRYIMILKMIHNFVNVKKIVGNIIVDTNLLKRAVYDYFVDIARVKEFHNIPKINTEKIYAYTAFWLQRRKPLQVRAVFSGSEFINELFLTSYLVPLMLAEKGIDGNTSAQNRTFNKFQELLYYNLKYRPITQQSLELMIEAFFCGFDFVEILKSSAECTKSP
ncbi:MAG: hypothetical protein LBC60_02125 [Spirochaetaceae bacterium]|jgi:hypothetical protein|nr:hypothetical protein [Spirochaetaceae bacterium]